MKETKMEYEEFTAVSFQVRTGAKKALEDMATADDRSLASLLRKIVDDYLAAHRGTT